MGKATVAFIALLAVAACGEVTGMPGTDGGDDDDPDASAERFSIGGMVANLRGTGLVLRNNGGDDLAIAASGTFEFATALASGTDFAVTVQSQPTGPAQVCTVSGGTGTVASADVTSVTVNCVTTQYTIGGTVTGLVGTARLRNTLPGGGTDVVDVSANGTYAFPTPVAPGSTFDVAMQSQPQGAQCYVTGPAASPGTGTVGNADVANVDLGCVATPVMSAIAMSCDTSTAAIQWTEVAGATYTLAYGPGGAETFVDLPAGTTSYVPAPALGVGDYVARVQAHRAGLDGVFSVDQPFRVEAVPVVTVTNSGAACVGGGATLDASPAGGTYAWTGPGGFTASSQTVNLTGLGAGGNMAGTYEVTVTVNGCSNSASTSVTTSSVPGSFVQTTTADFNANTNTSVVTTSNEVSLTDDLAVGSGTSSTTYFGNTTLAGGTYDYANFTVNAGVTLTITGSQPLVIRATGTVTINGTIQASGTAGSDGVTSTSAGVGGPGGPGGGSGGAGSYSASVGQVPATTGTGAGPGAGGTAWSGGGGGGHALVGSSGNNAAGGAAYGSPSITPLTTGSGAGGGSGGFNCGGGGGGGGGGYVQISATTISVGAAGQILVNGGNGGSDGTGNCGGGGGGSGGSIHLRARTLTVAGTLSSTGGTGGTSTYTTPGAAGSVGRIRLDGTTRSITGTVTPAAGMVGGLSYAAAGSSRTPSVAPANMCTWGNVSFTATTPGGSTFVVNVLNGTTNAVLLAGVTSGSSLAAIPATTPIKLQGVFGSTSSTATLRDWTATYTTR